MNDTILVRSVLWSPATICVAGLHLICIALSYYEGVLANLFYWISLVVAFAYIGLGCLVLQIGVSSRHAHKKLMALGTSGELPVEYASERSVHVSLIMQGLIMLTPALWLAKMILIFVR